LTRIGDRQSGAYMHRFAWTTIVRHIVVKSGASPDDPALADYPHDDHDRQAGDAGHR
jgi:RNA-directed DNA polymerase